MGAVVGRVTADRYTRGASTAAGGTERPALPPRRRAGERVLLGLEALLALAAYAGAIALLSGAMDFAEATDRLPFASTTLAGIALAIVNGVLPTAVLIGALRRAAWAGLGHRLVGAALMLWVVVQIAFLGWPPNTLQIIYFGYGVAILLLARRADRRPAVRP